MEEENKFLDLSVERQKIINDLREELQELENTGNSLSGKGIINRQATYQKNNNGGYFWVITNGQKEKATFSDLVNDAAYNIEYNLQGETNPEEIIKKYIEERAKVRLRNLYDIQLLVEQEYIKRQNVNLTKTDIYYRIKGGGLMGAYEMIFENSAGLIFEKNIINLLRQLEFDIPEGQIKISEADINQDINSKIDFILITADESYRRAVTVVEEEEKNDNGILGIEFIINPKNKKTTPAETNDLLFIRVPKEGGEILQNYKYWRAGDKSPGGPEKMYATNTKIDLLKEIFDGIGTNNIIGDNKEKLIEYYSRNIAK